MFLTNLDIITFITTENSSDYKNIQTKETNLKARREKKMIRNGFWINYLLVNYLFCWFASWLIWFHSNPDTQVSFPRSHTQSLLPITSAQWSFTPIQGPCLAFVKFILLGLPPNPAGSWEKRAHTAAVSNNTVTRRDAVLVCCNQSSCQPLVVLWFTRTTKSLCVFQVFFLLFGGSI